jgi:hypothetical protein
MSGPNINAFTVDNFVRAETDRYFAAEVKK